MPDAGLARILADNQLDLVPLAAIEIDILRRIELAHAPLLRRAAQQALDQRLLRAVALVADEGTVVARPGRPAGMHEQQVALFVGRAHAVADDVAGVAVAYRQERLGTTDEIYRFAGDNDDSAAAFGRGIDRQVAAVDGAQRSGAPQVAVDAAAHRQHRGA